MFKADLHNHTKYSDGILTPKELIDKAINNKVNVMAITDHDCALAIEEAFIYAKDKDIKIIGGIEISTYNNDESVHVLGYFKGEKIPQSLVDFSKDVIENRKLRAIKMMEKINEIYRLKIDLNTLFDGSTIITRGNMIRSLKKTNDHLTYDELSFYISSDSEAYIPSSRLTTKDGIKILKDAGCYVSLAHPTLLKKNKLEDLLELPFDAIEAKYYKNKTNETQEFIDFANKHNILYTAGSDDHGDQSHGEVGCVYLNYEEYMNFYNKL